MKNKTANIFRKISLGLVLMMMSGIINAQSFANTINQGLTDYIVPVVALVIVLGVIIGAIRNWEEINDKNTRKQGLVNIGMILLYALIFVGAIAAAIYIGSGLSIQI